MTSYQKKAEVLVGRLRAGPDDPVVQDVRTAFGVVERFATKAGEIRADKRFSAAGHSDEIRKALTSGPLNHLAQLRRGVERRLGTLKSELASFAPKAPDRSDVAGALDRREARDFLRAAKEGERMRLALDPEFREAVAHAPAVLSGLSREQKQQVVDAMVAETHGERVEFNQRGIEMLTEASTAIDEAAADLRRESRLTEVEFEAARKVAT